MECELHEGFERELTRVRDSVESLNTKIGEHEATLAALLVQDKTRENAVSKLESAMEKGLARLEGLISAQGTQLSALMNARPQKIAARWDDVVKSTLAWAVAAGIGGAITWFLTRGGSP